MRSIGPAVREGDRRANTGQGGPVNPSDRIIFYHDGRRFWG